MIPVPIPGFDLDIDKMEARFYAPPFYLWKEGYRSGELAAEQRQDCDQLFYMPEVYFTHTKGGGDYMVNYKVLGLILNFMVNFLLLFGICRSGRDFKALLRCASGGALWSVYGWLCFLPDLSCLNNWFFLFLTFTGVCWISFGGEWKSWGMYGLLLLSIGGILEGLEKGNYPPLLLIILGSGIFLYLFDGEKEGDSNLVPLKISVGKKSVSLLALKDTGNTLRDPISGDRVYLISSESAMDLTDLTKQEIQSPMETMAQGKIPGLRLIPFRSIGCEHGMLLGLRAREVRLGEKKVRAIIAFAPGVLGEGQRFQALVTG